jgi:hypothetical protein
MTTKITPYEVVCSQIPPTITSYHTTTTTLKIMKCHTTTLSTLKDNLHMAQNRMRQQVEQHHSERVFKEGDKMFLRLQP